MIRPGPESIDPGACPGGVVIAHYLSDGTLAAVAYLEPLGDIEAEAARAAKLVNGDVCLVAFDGDTGERMAWGLDASAFLD